MRRCRGDMRDAQAGHRPHYGDANEDQADHGEVLWPGSEQRATERRPQDNGQEGTHLHPAIGAGQLLVRQDLGQDAVFGRTEKGRVQGHQEQHPEHELEASYQECHDSQPHSHDFQRLGDHEHGALAVHICHVSGVAREEKERQDKNSPDQRQRGPPCVLPAAMCTASSDNTIL